MATLWLTLTLALSLAEPAPASATAPLPDELSALNELWGDEARLTERVRQFDLVQQGLADWDKQLAGEHQMAGDSLLAQQKVEEMRHRIDLVRRAYEEVLRRYPDNVPARVYLGEIYYDRLGRKPEAVRLWTEATGLDPKFAEAWNDLAIHYSHEGDVDKSLECFDKILALDPDNADFLFNVTQIYLIHWPQVEKHYNWPTAKVYEKAMEYSRRAAELRPEDYPLLADYAENFFRGEMMKVPVDWPRAAEAWQKARGRARNNGELFNAWLNEARVWLRAPQKDKAVVCLEEALRLYPQSQAAQNLLAQAKSG